MGRPDDLNYGEYQFNTSYMESMTLINFKALQLQSRIYTALLSMIRMKELLIIANLLQDNAHQKQINEYIKFISTLAKESKQINHTLHNKVSEMERRNKILNTLQNRMIAHWCLSKMKTLLPNCCHMTNNKSIQMGN